MFKDSFIQTIKKNEGVVNHMYLDTKGLVTVGIGKMLPNVESAQNLNFVFKNSSVPADNEAIAESFNLLKTKVPGKLASFYSQYTDLILPSSEIDDLLKLDTFFFYRGIADKIEGFPAYPEPAQEAMLDMAFNLGVHGLFRKFPTFIAHARAKNWEGCAKECNRLGIGDERNQHTKQLFESLT